MKLTVDEWRKMPDIVLPWDGPETGFRLTEIKGLCDECGTELTDLKGHIFESFGIVEMSLGGICPKCRHLVHCRSRVYPKKGVLAQESNKGWYESRMITFRQKWWIETVGMLKPMSVGFLITIMATIMGTKGPTPSTYMWWGIMTLVLFFFAVGGGWFIAKRK